MQPCDQVHLTVALKHSEGAREQLLETLMAVSTPGSERYGKHLSKRELDEMMAVTASKAAVEAWLADVAAGFPGVPMTVVPSGCGGFLTVRTTVWVAEELLGVELYRYRHPDLANARPDAHVRAMAPYSVPAQLEQHIAFVGGVLRLPVVHHRSSSVDGHDASTVNLNVHADSAVASNGTTVGATASSLRKLYKVDDVMGGKAAGNAQAVSAFLGQYASAGDLAEFFDLFFRAGKQEIAKVIGPNHGLPGTEANLDVQYIMSTGRPGRWRAE